MYTVYILIPIRRATDHVGHTGSRDDRIGRHNRGESKSTRGGLPWKQVYEEEFSTRGEAMRREQQIKKRGIGRFLRGVAQRGESVTPPWPRSLTQRIELEGGVCIQFTY